MVQYSTAVPEPGRPVPVAEGIFWLRLRLPFALDHVNCWIVDDGDGWTLIDAGLADAPTREVWDGLFSTFLAGRPVNRVLVTHFHPDHAGNAGSLVARTGAAFLMSRVEWLTGRMLALDTSEQYVEAGRVFDRTCGLPAGLAEDRARRGNAYRRGVDLLPLGFERLAAGDRLELAGSDFEVLIGEGHSPEQVTLWSAERNLLFAADQILPKITPNVAVWPSEPAADPLGDFMRSLARYDGIGADALVLPSHRQPFHGLPERLAQLRAHHDERLDATLAACAEPVSAYTAMIRLFPRALDLHQTGFALGETLAHLNRLIALGRIEVETAGDDVRRYRAAA